MSDYPEITLELCPFNFKWVFRIREGEYKNSCHAVIKDSKFVDYDEAKQAINEFNDLVVDGGSPLVNWVGLEPFTEQTNDTIKDIGYWLM
jgi:hypothetical protein